MSVSTSISMANNIRRARVTSSTSRLIRLRRVSCKCKSLTCFGLLSLHHAQQRSFSDNELRKMGAVLETLDARFVQIYETARAELVAHEQRRGLIVVRDDVMLLFRSDEPVRRFTGLG